MGIVLSWELAGWELTKGGNLLWVGIYSGWEITRFKLNSVGNYRVGSDRVGIDRMGIDLESYGLVTCSYYKCVSILNAFSDDYLFYF